MTLVTGHPARSDTAISVEAVGDAILFLTVASSSVVMFEPAPYDVLLSLHAVVALAMGLALPRAMAPLVILIFLYNVGGILSLTQAVYWDGYDHPNPYTFVVISLMLMTHAIFLAALTADRPHRMAVVMKATVAAGVIAAVLGLVGYGFKIEALLRFGRAKGAFKDPNVFGPFLVLPLVWLARSVMTEGLRRRWPDAVWALLLMIALFLSMSRAAWGLGAGCLIFLGLVLFVDEPTVRGRFRLIVIGLGGLLAVVAMLGIALSFEEVRSLFDERAKLVQDYDGARLGRFARHLLGFEWATELPLGLGPYQFAHYFPEDPHNVYLKSLMVYGWLGFVAYLALSLWTLGALFPSMFLRRPWKPLAQAVWVTLAGHQIVGWIIDSDHWRHFFLLWGLAWGMIALEAREKRQRRLAAAPGATVAAAPLAADRSG